MRSGTSLHHVGFDELPWSVADRADRLGLLEEGMHKAHGFVAATQIVYAKDYKARAAPSLRRTGEPLPQGPRPRLTQPLPDPLAHQRRQDHYPGYGGHRILQGMDPTTRPPLQPCGPEALGDRRHQNPGAKERALLTEEQQEELREALKKPPPDGGMWNSPKVGEWIERRTGKVLTPEKAEGLGVYEEAGQQSQGAKASSQEGQQSRAGGFQKSSR